MESNTRKSFFDFRQFRRVLHYAAPYKAQFFWSLALALVLGLLSPLRGLFIQYTVDKGIKGQTGNIPSWLNSWFDNISHNDAVRFLMLITMLQVALLLIDTVLRLLFSYLTAWLGQHVVKDMRVAVFQKVLGLNLRQYDQTPIGTLTTRTINDIESINDIFSDGLIPIIADLLTIVFTLLAMFLMDWQLTLICLIPFPLLIVATYFFKESVNRSFIKVRNAVAALNAFVQEHITGMQVVQAFAAEEREMEKFRHINRHHRNANVKAIFAYSVFFPVVEVVLAVATGLLVWWVAGQRIDAGKLIAFILFLNQIVRPLRVIADKFNVIQMGMVASERVFKVLDNEDTMPRPAPDAWQPAHTRGQVKFHEVWFAYQPPQWVLRNVSFSLQPGETLAIVGSTGSGKTTIISLLNRLYEVQQGSISLDGRDIRQFHPDSLRRQIGIVLQDVFLFSGSVLDNMTLRNPAISREQAIAVSQLIGLHDFIMELPGNYDFMVMERGATLSAGQRQLLSFARCLLYNPSLLILDEATSNIDSESEALIQQAIDQLIAGRTSIIVAHRLSTIRKANKIMVMEKGEVKEMGTHEELLNMGGHYARLHQLQFKEHRSPALLATGQPLAKG